MKIALLTLGTRGDVQPFVVLGTALAAKGHDVTLSTAKNFSTFVESYGLRSFPVEADFQEILNSPEGKKMMRNPLSAKRNLDQIIFPMLTNALHTFYHLSRQSDCVLFHVKAMADYFSEMSQATFIRTNVVPAIQPTSAFVNPVFSSWGLPSFLNRLSYKLTDLGLKMMNKPIKTFREKIGLHTKYSRPALPSIYGISPHFLNKPLDYPADSHFTGFWSDESTDELDPAVTAFARSGEPPLLLTLGSMPVDRNFNLPQLITQVTKRLNTRFIIVQGWGFDDLSILSENPDIMIIRSAPYDKLMPLVKAVIHHGGIGTIAACLKAGKPFLTCPILYPLGDQHFWGTVAYKKGVGLKPLPLKRLTLEKFLNAVKVLQSDHQIYINSEEMMKRIQDEDGVGNAIRLIEKYHAQ
jgi:sterol 3beta-glucosyltransferase